MKNISRTRFAAIDIETTGLFPKSDRVIEIAVLIADAEGVVCHTFETLLNPGRDLGPTGLHGIHGADVASAPTFGEISTHLLSTFSGSVIVGHNVRFDLSFLQQEFARDSFVLPDLPFVCTLSMAAGQDLGVRRLDLCCEALGLPCIENHTAAGYPPEAVVILNIDNLPTERVLAA